MVAHISCAMQENGSKAEFDKFCHIQKKLKEIHEFNYRECRHCVRIVVARNRQRSGNCIRRAPSWSRFHGSAADGKCSENLYVVRVSSHARWIWIRNIVKDGEYNTEYHAAYCCSSWFLCAVCAQCALNRRRQVIKIDFDARKKTKNVRSVVYPNAADTNAKYAVVRTAFQILKLCSFEVSYFKRRDIFHKFTVNVMYPTYRPTEMKTIFWHLRKIMGCTWREYPSITEHLLLWFIDPNENIYDKKV